MSELFLSLLLWPLTWAVPDFTTIGTLFVGAFPARFPAQVDLVCLTYSLEAKVTILKPKNLENLYTDYHAEHLTLERYKAAINDLGTKNSVTKSGIYPAFIVKASNPIGVFAKVAEKTNSDSFPLIPQPSCHKVYYATTISTYPFVSISTFDKETLVRVVFPKLKNDFDVQCQANKNCKSGSEVTVKLCKFQVWHFQLLKAQYHASLQNTLIEATNPVYVVSGNTFCLSPDQRSMDICADNAKPKVAWGKEYIVPYFEPAVWEINYYLLFNAVSTPLNVTLLFMPKSNKGPPVKETLNIVDLQKPLLYKVTNSFVVASETSFGVGIFYESKSNPKETITQMALVNLVPVEQWSNGAVNVVEGKGAGFDINNAYIVSTTPDVSIPEHKGKLTFDSMEGFKSRHKFYWTKLKLVKPPNRIFNSKPQGKVMVYAASKYSKRAYALRALDSYQGVINSANCTTSKSIPSDGVDNDCDGTIDEELKNDKDDDEDGKIDEDVILSATYSEWTPWTIITYMCNGKKHTEKVRTCKVGAFADVCPGKTWDCSPSSTCPKDCAEDRGKGICESIKDRCNNCSNGVCHECKEGFLISDLCLSPCPTGWGGIGCSIPNTESKGSEDCDDLSRENNKTSTFPWLLIALAFAVGAATSCCILPFILRRRRRNSEEKASPMGEEVEKKFEDDVENEKPSKNSDAKISWMYSGANTPSTHSGAKTSKKHSGAKTKSKPSVSSEYSTDSDCDDDDDDEDEDDFWEDEIPHKSPFGEGHGKLYTDFVDPPAFLSKAENARMTKAKSIRLTRMENR